jgi:hypothetical protein
LKPALTFLQLLIAAAFAGCGGSSEPTGRHALEEAFEGEFGFRPGPGVPDIKSRTVNVGDWWGHWMMFTYSSNIFQRVVSSGFKPVTEENLSGHLGSHWKQSIDNPSPNAPKWWKPPKNLAGVVFFQENSRSDFPASYAFIWADVTNGVIYLESCAWQ